MTTPSTLQRSPSGESKQIAFLKEILYLRWLWENMLLDPSSTGHDFSQGINELKNLMETLFELVFQNRNGQHRIENLLPEVEKIKKLMEVLHGIVTKSDHNPSYNPLRVMEELCERTQKAVQNFEHQGKNFNEDKDIKNSINKANNKNLGSARGLANTPPEKALNCISFLRIIFWKLIDIPLNQRVVLLGVCYSYMCHQVRNSSSEFDFQYTGSSNAERLVLSFGEAFAKSLPEMAHITKFVLCYFLNIVLGFGFHFGLQIAVMLMVIPAPLFYFPHLARKASGVYVASASFKLPIIWYASLGALGFSLLCGFLTLLLLYFSWLYIHKSRPRQNELKDNLDELQQILVE